MNRIHPSLTDLILDCSGWIPNGPWRRKVDSHRMDDSKAVSILLVYPLGLEWVKQGVGQGSRRKTIGWLRIVAICKTLPTNQGVTVAPVNYRGGHGATKSSWRICINTIVRTGVSPLDGGSSVMNTRHACSRTMGVG